MKNRNLAVFTIAAGVLAIGTCMAPAGEKEERANEVKASIYKHNQGAREWPEKLRGLAESPFTFYRATAHLFYEDLKNQRGRLKRPAGLEQLDLVTWICGDFHFQNVGVEAPTETLRFELNDFDEACQAPFYSDLIRVAASIHLMTGPEDKFKNDIKFDENDAEKAVAGFLKRYDEALGTPIDPANKAGLNAAVIAAHKGSSTFLQDQLKKAEKKLRPDDTLKALKLGANGRFDVPGPEQELAPVPCEAQIGCDDWEKYKKSLDPKFVAEKGDAFFTIKDRCQRLKSGLGSLGVLKVYLLIEGPTAATGDDIVLEAKESKAAAPLKAAAVADPEPAKRVSEGIRKLTADHDPLEGWFRAGDFSFHVGRIVPAADGFKVKDFKTKEDFTEFVQWTATALANAHARAGGGDFAKKAEHALNDKTSEVIAGLAKDYAQQVREDWASFRTEAK